MKYALLVLLPVALLLLSACNAQETSFRKSAPNIVLVTLDCLRADRLAAYGGDPAWTPNLNELAQKGAVFLNAHTAVATTFPSHATMFTGLYPRMHGVRSNKHTLPNRFRTLAERLQDAGYATGAFVGLPMMLLPGNLDQGFAVNSDPRRIAGTEGVRNDSETIALAMDWLTEREESDAQPFFLWVHLYQAHGAYRLTDWSRSRLQDYDGMLRDGASHEELRNKTREIINSPADWKALRVLYTGEVHAVDQNVGALMAALKAKAEAGDSVVIAVSDHGEGIGYSGNLGHGPVLREDVLRVAMIIADLRDDSSYQIEELVSTVDLTPTILDVAGVDTAFPFQGRSLISALKQGSVEPAIYYAEVARKPKRGAYGDWYTPNRVAVYSGGFKLAYRPAKETELFDLTVDPMARHPLKLEDYPTQVDYLSGLAADYLAREVESTKAKLSEKDIEILRSLGYIQ